MKQSSENTETRYTLVRRVAPDRVSPITGSIPWLSSATNSRGSKNSKTTSLR